MEGVLRYGFGLRDRESIRCGLGARPALLVGAFRQDVFRNGSASPCGAASSED